MFSFVFWLVWMTLTVALMAVMGWKQRFVTTKLSGEVVIVTRIKVKMVRIIVLLLTIIFSVMLAAKYFMSTKNFVNLVEAVDYTMPKDSSPVWSLFLAIVILIMLVICYNLMLRIVFNEFGRIHEKELREEKEWREAIRAF